jgi:hypothetical protein
MIDNLNKLLGDCMHLITNFLLFVVSFIFLLPINMTAQWSNDPSLNLVVCDTTGEQALAKIAVTSDGGTYISWFDNRSGSYAVYLQRLDQLGYKMWDSNGLLISNNPQSSSLVDYDLMVDENDNAVIVFTDTRNSGNLNVFAYRISPAGNFLWGANGISLSATADYQPNPKVTQTSDGNFVVAWIIATNPFKVALQKLSPVGDKLWGSSPVILSSATEGYNYPSIVSSDSNSVIILHTATTGSFPAQTVKLRATKVSENGTVSWMSGIQNIGTIAAFTVPKVYSDNNNGAIIAWHDDRDMNNLQSAFVQRISASGSLYYPANGIEISLQANRHKFNPVACIDPLTEEVYVFWRETNSLQNQDGITGQKLSFNGIRQWTDNGIIFKDLSSPNTSSISSLNTQMGNGAAYLFYLQGGGSGLNQIVEGFACNASGNFIWPGNFVTLSNTTQEKLQMVSAVDVYFNCKLAWGDNRGSGRGIYAQDINPSGQLGNPVVPVELISFTASVNGNNVLLNWVTVSEINNRGFEVERQVNNLWETVGFVEGKGTSSEFTNYSFEDNYLSSGTYSYRIKQLDFKGAFKYYNLNETIEIGTPLVFELSQNYPNPFNPGTSISWQSPVDSWQTLKVFDVLGNEIVTLVDEYKTAGSYQVSFDASYLSSGIYFYTLISGNISETKKMLLIR